MNNYSEIYTALDFADKYGAVSVTIELDEGRVSVPVREAIELFDNDLLFTLYAINFGDED